MSNKRIDLTQLGGFPLTEDALDFMQQSYRDAITGLSRLAGDAVILSGMLEQGNTVSAGWIVYNGELLPFLAGQKQTYFIIEDITGTETFEDDSVKTVYHTRQARFGSGAGQIAYADLTRLNDILTLQTTLDALNTNLTALNNALTVHEADQDNPHAVTKSQVGLSVIPNAKTDDPTVNDTEILATSADVYAATQMNKVVKTGTYHIGDIDQDESKNLFTINHNADITGTYVAMCVMRSAGTPTQDNDVIFVVYDLQANSFKVSAKEIVAHTQNLYLDYALIKA